MFYSQDAAGRICLDVMVLYQTAWRRLKRWSREGVWNQILASAQEKAYAIDKLSLETVAVDSSLIDSKKAANPQDTTDINTARE